MQRPRRFVERDRPPRAVATPRRPFPTARPAPPGPLARILATVLVTLFLMLLNVATFELYGPQHNRIGWLVADTVLQTLTALTVVSPLLAHPDLCMRAVRWAGVAVVATVLLDAGHFVAAGSLDLFDALSLDRRPITHSLLFAALCGALTALVTRRRAAGWLVFGALASHVMHDVWDGGAPFLWPLAVAQLPERAAHLSQVLLAGAMWWLAERSRAARQHGGTREP